MLQAVKTDESARIASCDLVFATQTFDHGEALESAEEWALDQRTGWAPWNLWGATPALEVLAGQGFFADLALRDGARVAVPGCGRGHDLRLLSKCGFAVTGFELSARAAAEARSLLRLNRVRGCVLRRDILGLLPEFEASFDLVYEGACFAAQPPYLRRSYARQLAGSLLPGGYLLALVLTQGDGGIGADGPPYVVQEDALAETFGAELQLQRSFAADGGASAAQACPGRWFLWRKGAAG